jgi:hypothetical protein
MKPTLIFVVLAKYVPQSTRQVWEVGQGGCYPEIPQRVKGRDNTGCGKLTTFFEYEMPYEKGS